MPAAVGFCGGGGMGAAAAQNDATWLVSLLQRSVAHVLSHLDQPGRRGRLRHDGQRIDEHHRLARHDPSHTRGAAQGLIADVQAW
jgi:hypothetical protein